MMKKTLHYALLIVSAAGYGIAYCLPIYCWWSITIFLVPLFYVILRDQVTVLDGLIWSVIALGMQLSGVLEGLFYLAQGPVWLRLAPALLVLALAVTYGFIWFLSTRIICRMIDKPKIHVVVWWITTTLFFVWMEHRCIFLLGVPEGYLLFSPLIPLVQKPCLLFFITKIGPILFLFFFIGLQACCALALFQGMLWWRIYAAMLFVWLSGAVWWYYQQPVPPSYAEIVAGKAFFPATNNIRHNARVLRDYMKKLLETYPQAQIIFFPETALRCPFMCGEPQIMSLLNPDELKKSVTIMAGGFRWDNDLYRNTVYWIDGGKVVDLFDKRHAMALTERLPAHSQIGNNALIKKTYFETFVGITAAPYPRPIWRISPDFAIIPYICSEIFFNNRIDHDPAYHEHKNVVLVAFCNDLWIARDYMKYQMLMGARYRALFWRIPIFYIAFGYRGLCMPNGSLYPVQGF